MVLQPNGQLVIAGHFAVGGVTRARIARYNSDGSLDTAFPPNGLSGNANATALESDGRIWVGGNFTFYNGTQVSRLMLLAGDSVVPGSSSPFENWAASFGLTPGNDGPGDHANNDGVANVFEYYFGTGPADAGSSDTTAITFVRVKNIEDVTLLPQASSNVNFSDSLGTTVESVVDIGNGLEEVTIRSSVSDAIQSTQFLRIQLSVP